MNPPCDEMKQVRKKDYKLLFLLVDLVRRGEYEKAKMFADRFYEETHDGAGD